MLQLFIITIAIVGLAFLGFAVKMLFKKNGEFKKSCSSLEKDGKRSDCICNGNDDRSCVNYEKHHGKG